jgi:hypothetical protein
MYLVPLVTPALAVQDYTVHATSFKWLMHDGLCSARDPVACCWLKIRSRSKGGRSLFAEESRDLELVLATPVSGRFRRNPDLPDEGAWASLLPRNDKTWQAGSVLGWVESEQAASAAPQELLRLFLAGRRVLEIAELREHVMTGWHDRVRGWWAPPGDSCAFSTLTSLGVCELQGIVRGEQLGFFDWFERAPGPLQMMYIPDHIEVPAAALLRSQLGLSPSQRAAIFADFAAWWERFLGWTAPPSAEALSPASPLVDLSMAAHFLSSATGRSPLDRAAVVSNGTLQECVGRHALLLSLNSELAAVAKHRRLEYILAFHHHRLQDIGPAFRQWLNADFEPVVRSVGQVRQDLLALFPLLRDQGVTDILMLNTMTGSEQSTVECFAPFDQAAFDSIVRKQELNLMLYELARETDISIVDVDDMGAQLGSRSFFTDMVHHSRAMEVAVRDEILRILRFRGVPGFSPTRAEPPR